MVLQLQFTLFDIGKISITVDFTMSSLSYRWSLHDVLTE